MAPKGRRNMADKPRSDPPLGTLAASALETDQMPTGTWPELAFMGRSNAGKSSLINAITGKKIARASSDPGKTVRIHFYQMRSWYLVDLPGFGYAKVSKQERERFGQAVERYLTTRQQLLGGILIQDCRRDPEPDEAMVVHWADESNRYLVVVANKMDKLNRREQADRLARLEEAYGRKILMASARTGEGLEAVQDAVLGLGLAIT